jgi:hypothetical protein
MFCNGIFLHKVRQYNLFSILLSSLSSIFLALSYTKNNFVRVPNDVVVFDNRKWRILEQIIARQPDLCALEEMDIFNDFLKDELPKYG